MTSITATDVWTIADEIRRGKVVFFLGAGVNMSGRLSGEQWTPDKSFLPKADELARVLAKSCGPAYEKEERRADLSRIAQYTALTKGSAALYEDLHPIFDRNYPPTVAHHFLAQLPVRLRRNAKSDVHALIVTTNYDDLLEIAFNTARVPFDLCSYIAEGAQRGRFVHMGHDGVSQTIEKPNEYTRVSTMDRSVIMKVHGSVKRGQSDAHGDDYVITEEHYLDYLANSHAANLFPVKIIEKIRRSHILFLGYGLRDWNFRVLLRQIWAQQRLHYTSWAIQLKPDTMSEEFWRQHGVKIIDSDLVDFMKLLDDQLETRLKPEAVA